MSINLWTFLSIWLVLKLTLISATAKIIATLDGQTVQNGVSIPLYALPLGMHIFRLKSADLAGNESNFDLIFDTYTDIDSLKTLVMRFADEGKIKAPIADTLQSKLKQNQLKTFINLIEAQRVKPL